MLLGHGCDAMTYQHYVHTLDLLLHIGCTPKNGLGYAEKKKIREGEKPLFNCVLGLHPTTVIATNDPVAINHRLRKRFPDAFEACQPLFPVDSAPRPPDAEVEDGVRDPVTSPQITLQQLLPLIPENKLLKSQAARDTIKITLGEWTLWQSRDADAARSILKILGNPMKGRDYVSLSIPDAQRLLELAFNVGCAPDDFDCLHVQSIKGTRKTEKKPVPPKTFMKWPLTRAGKIWLRLRDPRRGPEAERQRTQAAVTWTLKTILSQIS